MGPKIVSTKFCFFFSTKSTSLLTKKIVGNKNVGLMSYPWGSLNGLYPNRPLQWPGVGNGLRLSVCLSEFILYCVFPCDYPVPGDFCRRQYSMDWPMHKNTTIAFTFFSRGETHCAAPMTKILLPFWSFSLSTWILIITSLNWLEEQINCYVIWRYH